MPWITHNNVYLHPYMHIKSYTLYYAYPDVLVSIGMAC
jgi:hypothetical protein